VQLNQSKNSLLTAMENQRVASSTAVSINIILYFIMKVSYTDVEDKKARCSASAD